MENNKTITEEQFRGVCLNEAGRMKHELEKSLLKWCSEEVSA